MKDDSRNKFGFNVLISSLPVTVSLLNLTMEEGVSENDPYLHRHAGLEIHGVIRGECNMRVEGSDYPIREGEICLIPPGAYHAQKRYLAPFSKYTVGFELDEPPRDAHDVEGTRVYRALQALLRSEPIVLSCPRLQRLVELMREVAEERDRLLAPHSMLCTLTALYILEAAQCLPDQMADAGAPPSLASGMQTRNSVIDDYFSRSFSVCNGASLLARRLSVSRRQLDRVLHKAYGKSFREKLLEARLKVALDLLRTSDKSVAEISEILGYSTPANFSTFIKRQVGKSPTQLRGTP